MGKSNGGKSTSSVGSSNSGSKNISNNGNGHHGHGGTRSRPLITIQPKRSQSHKSGTGTGDSPRPRANGSLTSTPTLTSSNNHNHSQSQRNQNSLTGATTPSTTTSSSTPSTTSSPRIDKSQTNFNYDLRLNGFSSLINTVKKSTDKVKKLLLNECDVILECRVCRNLFRSIPNYISHKESFCTVKYHPVSTQGFSHLIQNGPSSSSFQIHHHVQLQNSMADKLRSRSEEQSQSHGHHNHKSKRTRLEQVLSRIGPTVEAATRSPSSLYTHIAREVEKKNQEPRPQGQGPQEKVHLLIDPLPERKDGIAFQTRVQVDPSICDTGPGSELRSSLPLCPSDTAVLDSEGKVLFAGAGSVVQDIVSRVITQIEDKHKEETKRMKLLNCPACHTVFDTEKSLRTHARTHCRRKKPSAAAGTSGTLDKKKEIKIEGNERATPDPIERTRKQEKEKRPKSVSSSSVSNCQVDLDLVKEEKPVPVVTLTSRRSGSVTKVQEQRTLKLRGAPSLEPKNEKEEGEKRKSTGEKALKNNEGVAKRMQAAAGSVIPFIPTSPIFSFKSAGSGSVGRTTNNSCSASLSALSPIKSDLDAISKQLFPSSPTRSNPQLTQPKPSMTLTSVSMSLPKPHLQSRKSCIQIRHDYVKDDKVKVTTTQSPALSAPELKPQHYTPPTPDLNAKSPPCYPPKIYPEKIMGPIGSFYRPKRTRPGPGLTLTLTSTQKQNGGQRPRTRPRPRPRPYATSLVLLNHNEEKEKLVKHGHALETKKIDRAPETQRSSARERDPDVENNNQGRNCDLDPQVVVPTPLTVSVEKTTTTTGSSPTGTSEKLFSNPHPLF